MNPRRSLARAAALLLGLAAGPVLADGPLSKVNHIIVVMQENHSFDNYFGVLPYATGCPYHPATPFCCGRRPSPASTG